MASACTSTRPVTGSTRSEASGAPTSSLSTRTLGSRSTVRSATLSVSTRFTRTVALGIDHVNGGNVEIPAPEITTITNTTIGGTSLCGGCTVDIFSDDEDEGRVFFSAVITDITGAWSILGAIPGATNVTATLTSPMQNSSEFSSPEPYDTDGDGWVNGLPSPIDNCPSMSQTVSQLNTDAAAAHDAVIARRHHRRQQ